MSHPEVFGPPVHVPSFNELAKQLDPMLPQEDYNGLREKYFKDHVLPRLRPEEVASGWTEFQKGTERQSLLSAPERLLLRTGLTAAAATKGMIEPLTSIPEVQQFHQKVTQDQEYMRTLARREGISTGMAEGAGTLLGAGISLEAAMTITGPIAAGLSKAAFTSARTIQLASRALRGGLAFATYEAGADQTGDRMMAGLKGFGMGAAGDLLLGLPAYLRTTAFAGVTIKQMQDFLITKGWRAQDAKNIAETFFATGKTTSFKNPKIGEAINSYFGEVAKDVVVGKPVSEKVNEAASTYLQNQQVVAKKEGRPNLFLDPSSPKAGVRVAAETVDGRTSYIKVEKGRESEALNVLQQLLDKGGALDTVEWHPTEHDRAISFLRELADKNGVKYDQSLLVKPASEVEQYVAEVKKQRTIDTQDLPPEKVKVPTIADRSIDTYNEHRPYMDVIKQVQQEMGPGFDSYALQKDRDRLILDRFKAAKLPVSSNEAGFVRQMYLTYTMPKQYFKGTAEELEAALTKQRIPAEVKGGKVVSVSVHTQHIPAATPKVEPVTEANGWEKYLESKGHSPDTFQMLPKQQRADITGNFDEWYKQNEWVAEPLTPEQRGQFAEAKGEAAKVTATVEATASLAKEAGEMPKMSYQQATQYIVGKGFSPKEVDIDAVMYLGKEELDRLFETAQKSREVLNTASKRGQASIGPEMSEDITFRAPTVLTSKEGNLVANLGLDPESYGVRVAHVEGDLTGQVTPGRVTIVASHSVFQRIAGQLGLPPDMEGLTWKNWQEGLRRIGGQLPEGTELPNSPLVLVREGVTERTLYHEGLHTNFVNAELSPMEGIPKGFRGVWTEVARGFGSEAAYKGMKFPGLVDEAFAWLAEGILYADQPLLNKLAAYDRSVEHLYEAMNGTATQLLEMTASKLDSPGVRVFQEKLEDLIRRTSKDVFAVAERGLKESGELLDFSPEMGTWSIGDKSFTSLNEAWDYIAKQHVGSYTADPSFWAQARGVRGPIVPPASPPGKNLPLPDFSLTKDQRGFGWTSVSGWFRPFLPWVAVLDRKLTTIAATKGVQYPLFARVKAVDEAVRTGQVWLDKWTGKFGDILQDWSHPKQQTLFNLLTYKPEEWAKVASKLKLGEEELKSAGRLVEQLKEFQQDVKVPVLTYLQEYLPKLKKGVYSTDAVPGWGILKDPKFQGFWEKAVSSGDLDPKREHAGEFLKWLLKVSYEKKYTGEPLRLLSQLVERKTPQGNYVLGAGRWPLTNYVKYMKGVPDSSAQALNKVMGDVQGFLVDKFKAINKMLPEGVGKLPEEFSPPGQAINKLMLLSYAGGLALRPAIVVRDALQVLITGMPVIGVGAFNRGLARTLTREGYMFAEQAGAQLRQMTVGELYGDIFSEMALPEKGNMAALMRFSQKLLGPSRWGNNFARSVVFNGVFGDALEAVEAFRAGKLTQEQFLHNSHLWFADQQIYTSFLSKAVQKANKVVSVIGTKVMKDIGQGYHFASGDLAKDIALQLVDDTQWAYRRGTAPAVLRTGLGRIFGQYGNWPLNYAEYLNKLGKKYSMFPRQTIQGVGTWAAINFAAAKAMEGIGADSSRWLWTSPASFGGGPNVDFARDLAGSLETGTQEGEAARARVLRYPFNFVPGSIALRSYITALEGQEDLSIGGKGFIRMMGFKPLEEVNKDQDYMDWLLEESGVTANPYRR